MTDDNKKKSETIKEQEVIYPEFDRFEIIEGVYYDLSPGPTVNHQKLITQLWYAFYKTCHPNGVILVAPLDVYLDQDNHFQPDFIFITNENNNIINEKRIEGAPDLVAEILSPNTSTNDKIRKKRQYERFGVKEYWVVDPVHVTVDQFALCNHAYNLQATYADNAIITSDLFPCISVDTHELFSALHFRYTD